ncbi:unnamed protein product [Protopolystoma xenopodis]|uniref:Amino acid permease/ SLC12A domain-containing protein n=1 Tax=Protopolystoma xenopodis TaxID=117903 RepID=A0A448WC90_9PLAT|nr:unnamed protein product [Protopolystoma xenopodis]
MIGSSIFILTGTVVKTRAGPATFVAYLLAGLVAFFNAMVYSELACRFPKAGSVYTYAYTILGEMLAFLTGWAVLLEYILSAASVARGWSSILNAMTGGQLFNSTIVIFGRY